MRSLLKDENKNRKVRFERWQKESPYTVGKHRYIILFLSLAQAYMGAQHERKSQSKSMAKGHEEKEPHEYQFILCH